MADHIWRKANTGLVPSGILTIGAVIIASSFGKIHGGTFNQRLIALIGIIIFLLFSSVFIHILTNAVYNSMAFHKLGRSRAVAIQFLLRILGYVIIFLVCLSLLDIPIERLLIGGAALGIILGVAAQESLSNFFASIVIIVSHLFTVGDTIIIKSGPLGGNYEGKVVDIGLTHTTIEEKDGKHVHLPNSTLLSGAAIQTHVKD